MDCYSTTASLSNVVVMLVGKGTYEMTALVLSITLDRYTQLAKINLDMDPKFIEVQFTVHLCNNTISHIQLILNITF